MTEATNFLDFCFDNKRINKTDKQEILLLHTNLQTYNYDDVFSPDVVCKFHKTHMNFHRTIIENSAHYLLTGTVINKNKNRIFKIWVTNKDHPCSNDVCFQMLIEYHFQNIFVNNVTDSILIVPQTYNYGKVILNTNNEILYFYEMEYYDSRKYVLDSIIDLGNESKLRKLLYFHSIQYNGYTAICNMESRISITHGDIPNICHDDSNDIEYSLDSSELLNKGHLDAFVINNYNMLICNDKLVLIDFGEVARSRERKSRLRDYNKLFNEYTGTKLRTDDYQRNA
tara:strand:- start:384 stop:1235 length:852 start_codon:yes stop_codon:yes gene_type:complete